MQERTKRSIFIATFTVFLLLACSSFGFFVYDGVKGEEGTDDGIVIVPCKIKIKSGAIAARHVNFTFFKDWSREEKTTYDPSLYSLCYFHIDCILNNSQELRLERYACSGFWRFILDVEKYGKDNYGFSGTFWGGSQMVPYDNPLVLTITLTNNGCIISQCICGKESCPYN